MPINLSSSMFYMDFSPDYIHLSIFILICLFALSIYLFIRGSHTLCGFLLVGIGFLLSNANISFLVAGLPMVIGLLIVIKGDG